MTAKLDPEIFGMDSTGVRLAAHRSERIVRCEGKHMLAARHNRGPAFPWPALATVDDQNSYIEEINQRANKQTRVMEEILSHHHGIHLENSSSQAYGSVGF
jgi:hypothetical protein